MNDITVCLTTIPPRAEHLAKALASVAKQTLQPVAIIVEYDHHHTGAAATKNRALERVTSDWVAWLDDDDEFWPEHLATLRRVADEQQADFVYSIPFVPQAGGPVSFTRPGIPFDEAFLRAQSFIQTTVLTRTKFAKQGGGFWCPEGSIYDDWGYALGCLDAGARLYHHPEPTFTWNHWGYGTAGVPGNTSGQSHRW